jgi:hypothetical protein
MIYIKIIKPYEHDMFRPLFGHHQVCCLCLGAERFFLNLDPYFEYGYIRCNIMLGKRKYAYQALVQNLSASNTPDDDPIRIETCRVLISNNK